MQFDRCVLDVGLEVENALAENQRLSKGKRKKPELIIERILAGPEGLPRGDLSKHPGLKKAKLLPGEDPLAALMRLEKNG